RNLARNASQQRRLHRESGNWRVILDNNLDIHRVRERRVVPHDSVRIQFRQTRWTHHDGGRADLARVPAVCYAGPSSVRSCTGNDTDATFHMLDHNLEHATALTIVEPRNLTRDAKRCHAVDAGADEQVDYSTKTGLIEVAVGV